MVARRENENEEQTYVVSERASREKENHRIDESEAMSIIVVEELSDLHLRI